ncbi:hypothetical protein VTN77DRAFT_121 [Rasamsonia byssochlamydoides]|uniref:uncharacterized protein n=1 Tax=Rasamsonia byssochlamydoides TaxID=89139 RepID=UPI0037420B05
MAFDPIPLNQCVWKEYLAAQEAKLPSLADVEDVSDRVIRIMGGNPGAMQLQGTNTYLVGTGKSRILVDTGQGIPIWAENLIKLLEERDLDISHVLLTHWHGDHTGGVPDLVRYNPALAARIYKNRPDRGQQAIEDGDVFQCEGATLRALFTPGHAEDHMCFILEEENALFTGDNVLGHGYSVAEDLGAYVKSLVYMEDQHCAIGYPAHGVKIDNLPQKIRQYIRHKKMRERQIYLALVRRKADVSRSGGGKGSMTTRELVEAVHGAVPDDLFEMALEPFTTEVLWKLAEDRKVGFQMDGGSRRWFLNERTWETEKTRL